MNDPYLDGAAILACYAIAVIGVPGLVAANIARYLGAPAGILAFIALAALTLWGMQRALNPENYK